MSLNSSEAAEEIWKDDDFLSFAAAGGGGGGGGAAGDIDDQQDDEDQDDDDDAVASTPRSVNEQVEEEKFRCYDKSLPPWMNHRTDFRRVPPLVALHNEMVAFAALMSPMKKEIDQRNKLVKRFESLAIRAFGVDKCDVAVFGSQATGLFLPSSDIDIVVNVKDETCNEETKQNEREEGPGNENGESGEPREDEKEEDNDNDEAWKNMRDKSPLEQLADTIREEWQDEISYLEVIPNTKVPLVKFTHAPTGLSVDVSFVKETGPQAAVLMKTFMEAMPPLRPLIFVLKYFLAARVLNEPYSGGVGSYLLQLMIVSFLQHRERDIVNFGKPGPNNLGCLLLDFFDLYGSRFNYCTTGISVRHDGSYFRKGERKDLFVVPARPFSVAMENPLDIKTDVGKASFRIQMVHRAFSAAYKVLLAHVSHPAQPTASILATIMPPTEEMFRRKKAKDMCEGKPTNGNGTPPQREEMNSPQKKKRRLR